MGFLDELNTDKEKIITFILVIVAVVVFAWIVVPFLWRPKRVMIQIQKPKMETMETFDDPNTNAPKVDAKVGSLIDGPGYEVGGVASAYQPAYASIPSNYYFLDDGAGGAMSIQHNLCSKSCCSEQWPTPHKMKHDPYVCGNKDKFVGSRIMCNNTFQDSGCLCLTKKQAAFIYNRGGNGREWF
uniref:Uncharacterized protein n=1 Tax=Mimivirus LCMiAC01 TaxID=2506608 RepID=A0A481Z0V0_9VIRU|nr:MAG: uncharacterized protein LCMiAC01_04730 [Mimivirus LCMiAC01]